MTANTPTAAHNGHSGTTSTFDHPLSAQLDLLIVQFEHESTGHMHGAVLKLRKRWLERAMPHCPAKVVRS